jgi:hypothetical protein
MKPYRDGRSDLVILLFIVSQELVLGAKPPTPSVVEVEIEFPINILKGDSPVLLQ